MAVYRRFSGNSHKEVLRAHPEILLPASAGAPWMASGETPRTRLAEVDTGGIMPIMDTVVGITWLFRRKARR